MHNSTHHQIQLDAFGPQRLGTFDFTLLFEQSFFAIAPASLFLIAAAVRTASLYGNTVKVISSAGRQIKIAFLSAFVALNLTLLILWAVTPAAAAKTSTPAASLDFVAAIVLFILSSYEHTRSVAPSTLIAIYLVLTLPLDVARVRTLFLLDGSYPTKTIAAVSATSLVIKLGILLSEALSKQQILLQHYQHLPPEATSSPYSRLFFWWVNPLLWRGFRNFFEIQDLYNIDDSLSSATLGSKFQRSWKAQKKIHKYSLLTTVFSVLKCSIVASGVPRLLLIGLEFCQPFLIQRTIKYVSNRHDQPGNVGWGLVGAYAIVYIGLALATASSTYLMNRIVVKIRGGLVSLIYQKTVDLSIIALEEGAALTLMSTDVERITDSFVNLNNLWAAIIQVAIALYLLYTELGVGFVAPGICFICALVAMTICTSLSPRYQTIWVQGIQSRVSSTSSMLSSMKSIRLLGLTAVVGKLIQELRIRENVLARKFRWVVIFRVLFQNITSILAPLTTFVVYVIQANSKGKTLDVATAYSILSILQLVEPQLLLLVQTPPRLVAALGCVTRIQTFLLAPSRHDRRMPLLQDRQNETTIADEEGIALRELGLSSNRVAEDMLVLDQCSFGWAADTPLVHNINMRIQRGSLCIVIGPTGCGKSTLLKGILGETPFLSGFVYSDVDSIAFADQVPWTINSTIQAGVCGESSFDERFYQEVIECCGLQEDLRNLSKGDMTIIGSKGISLSGGQKSRLALARAVFARKDVLILDDVFSGIDADTEEHIFRKLFGKSGLLRRNGTAVLLVTHAVARLSYADWVVVLNKNGAIAEQGTYSTLRESGAYVASLDLRFKQTTNEDVDQPTEANRLAVDVVEADEEEAANLSARKTGDWDTYKYYFAAAGGKSTVLATVLAFIYIGSVKSPGLIVSYFTGPDKTISSNKIFLIIIGSTSALSLVSVALLMWQLFQNMIPRASNGLHESLLNTVLEAPFSFFTKTDSGTTLNRFSQDLTVIDNELSNASIAVILQLALFVIGAGLMASTASYFLATIPITILVLFAVQKFYLRTSRQLRHLELEAKAPLYTHFQETLSGLASIRAFGWVEQFCSTNFALLDRSQNPVYLLLCIQCWLAVVLDLLVAALATILMSIIVSLRHKMDPGFVGLGLLNVMSFNTSMSLLIKMWTLTETSIGAIARVRDFVSNTESEIKSVETVEPPLDWPSSGAIELRGFAASYSESSNLVLEGLNLTIKPGEKLGICGRSGSGKSSLLASLFHLLEFREGSIKIDGQDTAFVPRELLRRSLNAIPQESYLITTKTVRFNLHPWPGTSANDETLINALTKCQIWDVIREKGGLDAKLSVDSLSHGQQQLFCLARSLLRKSKVVVLDEVSSRYFNHSYDSDCFRLTSHVFSVDIHTDSIIQAIIREDFRDCTIISVAHRLNTLVDFDRVAVLHRGRIIECDTPQVLLSRPNSRFKELWEL
jgi:ATP-binding cassette subfamily C (CFTR/MRP) protein 1